MVQRRGTPRAGKSGSGRGNNPPPLSLGGVVYAHGIGTLSINELIVDLKGQATRFESMIGIDDAAAKGQGSVNYEIWVDNKRAFISPLMKAGDPPQSVSVNLTGAKFMELLIDDGGDVSTGDYANWAGAVIHLKPGATAKPESWTFPSEPAPPIASGWPAAPRINAPRITGGTPGRPFLFRIPATGEAPLTFRASGSARRTEARRPDRHHQRDDRRGRTHERHDRRSTNAQGRDEEHTHDCRRRRRARADAAARLELVERLGRLGGRREGAGRRRRDGLERPRRARLPVHQHRRRLGRRSATRTACCSRTRSSPT